MQDHLSSGSGSDERQIREESVFISPNSLGKGCGINGGLAGEQLLFDGTYFIASPMYYCA